MEISRANIIENSGSPAKKMKKSLSSEDLSTLSSVQENIENDVVSIRADIKHNFVQACLIPTCNAKSSPHQKLKVETCKRFMCLTSKLVAKSDRYKEKKKDARGQFHRLLLKMSNSEKPIGTQENSEADRFQATPTWSQQQDLWQSEFKDLIWLELQAWFADRTLSQQDMFLCDARQTVRSTLSQIMNFRFNPPPRFLHSQGIFAEEFRDIDHPVHMDEMDSTLSCEKCLYIFCSKCIELQNIALMEVVKLFEKLEKAESLYPSSKAFAAHHPLYASEPFVARLKTLNIWFNTTKQLRFRLLILARTFEEDVKDVQKHDEKVKVAQAHPSTMEEDEGACDLDEHPPRKVERSDSGFSSNSTGNETPDSPTIGPFQKPFNYVDFYDIKPIAYMGKHFPPNQVNISPTYKNFIKKTLKKRGLVRSLYFLEKLHKWLVRQQKTFEIPEENNDSNSGQIQDDFELAKYGYWSKEFKQLNLPSSRAVFLFLARIPLDMMHSYFRLRLETNPQKPSPLSLLQLMTELKKGIRIAVLNKQRYLRHVTVALRAEEDSVKETFNRPIVSFDESLQQILELYLKYLQEWVNIVQQEAIKKYILEEEWAFVKSISPHIPGGRARCGSSFCQMASSMLRGLCNRFQSYKCQSSSQYFNNGNFDEKLKIYEQCQEFLCNVSDVRDKMMKTLALAKVLRKDLEFCEEMNSLSPCSDSIAESLDMLKTETLNVCKALKYLMKEIHEVETPSFSTEFEVIVFKARKREVLSAVYKFGFECHREATRLVTGQPREKLSHYIVEFAYSWIAYVHNYFERGRGLRPRWATHGLDFIILASEPANTNHMSDNEFEVFKDKVNFCIQYIIGTNENQNGAQICTSSILKKNSTELNKIKFCTTSNINNNIEDPKTSSTTCTDFCQCKKQFQIDVSTKKFKIGKAVIDLEDKLESKRRDYNLIGCVVETKEPYYPKFYTKQRSINFSWQRGFKIGQGRFGKVYTAVNNETGELVAMKEIQLQKQNNGRFIQDMLVELRILEGITHSNLVKYYGVEFHREELLLFMELCTEGTLESLVQSTEDGLPEVLIRRYTKQLVDAINLLHKNAIVHRDIKSANIFLTAEGHSLKLGDFGSAVKMNAHTTVPGELNGFVGTQAYMAPEVFMNTNSTGHGRAVDIWSLGCVLVEMSSGKRPWAEYDSNYQIMFKVGMGETPSIPESLSDEGQSFGDLCLRHDPTLRASIFELSQHPFLIGSCDEDGLTRCPASASQDYFKLGIVLPPLTDDSVKGAS
uniref:Mitogen-activated protein kinase kinase kinase 4 n=4 Tax=Cacopsylla melanoneura TaxID=428564 RepID=A0A8D8PRX7_9HEMI